MKGTKGFTLIELAVVLAIIAVLAAILTPLVSNYMDQARTARAASEVRTIADAIRLHHRDVGKYPIYTSMSASSTPSGYNLMKGPGIDLTTFSGTGWTGFATTSFSLVTHLQTNAIGAATTGGLGKAVWRGPYIAALDSDPWGYTYIVTAYHLHNTGNYAFVLSAGPDGAVDTNFSQANSAAFTVGDDDIAVVIR